MYSAQVHEARARGFDLAEDEEDVRLYELDPLRLVARGYAHAAHGRQCLEADEEEDIGHTATRPHGDQTFGLEELTEYVIYPASHFAVGSDSRSRARCLSALE